MSYDEKLKEVADKLAELVMKEEIYPTLFTTGYFDKLDTASCINIIPGDCWSTGVERLESLIDFVDPAHEIFRGYDNSDGLGLDSAWYNIYDGKLFFDIEWTDKMIDKMHSLHLEIPVDFERLGRYRIEYHDKTTNKDVKGFVSKRFETLYVISEIILEKYKKNPKEMCIDEISQIFIRDLKEGRVIYFVDVPSDNKEKWNCNDYLL